MDRREAIIAELSGNAAAGGSRRIAPVKLRREALRKFAALLASSRDEIYDALTADLNRDHLDSLIAELLPLIRIVRFLARKLPSLSRPRRLPWSAATFPAGAKLHREPFGRVLVVSTWNYPLLLSLEPAAGAYAAGNRVFLKLSPRSPHTNEVIAELIGKAFPAGEITVIGDELSFEETISFRYDYIFLTGNAASGRRVLAKAAASLTPCTLELGGKNPCIVAPGADLPLAARRIVWGKFFNAGQSCAAPDYLLVHRDLKDELMNHISACIRRMYGDSPLASGNFPSMPDADAYERMIGLIGSGRLVCGGNRNPRRLTLEPTVIDRIPDSSPLFTGEVFGPVLPVREFASEAELHSLLSGDEHPLAAYCFGGDRRLKRFLTENFPCGALVFNDVLIHFSNMHIPFGGVGSSGFGAYHGVRTFTTFTHEKPVMKQSGWFDLPFRYPPHRDIVRRVIEFFCRVR